MRLRHVFTIAAFVVIAVGGFMLARPSGPAEAYETHVFEHEGCAMSVTFLGKSENHTWSYEVTNLSEKDADCNVRYFVLELCKPAYEAYVTSEPEDSSLTEHDIWTGLKGIEWEIDDENDFESGIFTVTFSEQFKVKDDIKMGFKTDAQDKVFFGKLEGPSCDEKPTPTNTAEPTSTATNTSTPEEATSTPPENTATPTNTPVDNTATPTSTPVDNTATPVDNTATPTATEPVEEPSATPTSTPESESEGEIVLPSAGEGPGTPGGGDKLALGLLGVGLALLIAAWGGAASRMPLHRED